jgi:hypothetical protein
MRTGSSSLGRRLRSRNSRSVRSRRERRATAPNHRFPESGFGFRMVDARAAARDRRTGRSRATEPATDRPDLPDPGVARSSRPSEPLSGAGPSRQAPRLPGGSVGCKVAAKASGASKKPENFGSACQRGVHLAVRTHSIFGGRAPAASHTRGRRVCGSARKPRKARPSTPSHSTKPRFYKNRNADSRFRSIRG